MRGAGGAGAGRDRRRGRGAASRVRAGSSTRTVGSARTGSGCRRRWPVLTSLGRRLVGVSGRGRGRGADLDDLAGAVHRGDRGRWPVRAGRVPARRPAARGDQRQEQVRRDRRRRARPRRRGVRPAPRCECPSPAQLALRRAVHPPRRRGHRRQPVSAPADLAGPVGVPGRVERLRRFVADRHGGAASRWPHLAQLAAARRVQR